MRRASSPSTAARFSVGGIEAVFGTTANADVGLQQFDQVAFGGDLMAAIDVERHVREANVLSRAACSQ